MKDINSLSLREGWCSPLKNQQLIEDITSKLQPASIKKPVKLSNVTNGYVIVPRGNCTITFYIIRASI